MPLDAGTTLIELGEDFRPLFDPEYEKTRYFVIWGGRGKGASTAAALCAILRMRERKNYSVVVLRDTENSITSSALKLVKSLIIEHGFEHEFDMQETKIRHIETKAELTFQGVSNKLDALRSLEGTDLAVCEEFAAIKLKAWNVLDPTIRAPGAQMVILYNPDEQPGTMDLIFRGPNAPADAVVIHTQFDRSNPFFFRTSMVNQMRRMRASDPDQFDHIWRGEHATTTRLAVFREGIDWSVGYCDVPAHVVPVFGADWGMSPDPSAGVKCWIIPPPPDSIERGVIYISHACADYDLGTAQLPQFLDEGLPHCRRFQIVADSSEKRVIADLGDEGFDMVGARKGPGSIISGIRFLKGYHIRIAPDDTPGLIMCRQNFRDYKHKVDPKTGLKTSTIIDANNHFPDAVRYACDPDQKPLAPVQVVNPHRDR